MNKRDNHAARFRLLMTISLDLAANARWLVARARGELGLDEAVQFLRTARSKGEARHAALLFDATGANTRMTEADVERMVDEVSAVKQRGEEREHVAIVADDDALYSLLLRYEVRCAEIGVRVIRVFRQRPEAEQWLEAMVGARHFR